MTDTHPIRHTGQIDALACRHTCIYKHVHKYGYKDTDILVHDHVGHGQPVLRQVMNLQLKGRKKEKERKKERKEERKKGRKKLINKGKKKERKKERKKVRGKYN